MDEILWPFEIRNSPISHVISPYEIFPHLHEIRCEAASLMWAALLSSTEVLLDHLRDFMIRLLLLRQELRFVIEVDY